MDHSASILLFDPEGGSNLTDVAADMRARLRARADDDRRPGSFRFALFLVTAAAVAAGVAMEEGAALANLAAGLVVRKLGVASVTPSELRLAQHQRGKGGRGVLDEEALAVAMRQARDRGERVVMASHPWVCSGLWSV